MEVADLRWSSPGAAPSAAGSGAPHPAFHTGVKPSRVPLTIAVLVFEGPTGSRRPVGTRGDQGPGLDCVSSGLSLHLLEPCFSHPQLGEDHLDPSWDKTKNAVLLWQ